MILLQGWDLTLKETPPFKKEQLEKQYISSRVNNKTAKDRST